jgi:hypothetical protein
MNILKQYHVGRIGAFIHVLYLTMPLFGAISYTMSAITMYTVLLPYLKPSAPWLSAPLFFGICICLAVVTVLLFYKFVYPSYMSFQNKQEYSHNSLLRKDLEKIKQKMGIND